MNEIVSAASSMVKRERTWWRLQTLELVLLLVAASLALTLLANRLQLPSAVLLVLGGMVLAFLPGLPTVELEPTFALALFLPPLLQASALRTDWNAFRENILFIVLLAFGAVLFTAGVVAVAARQLLPDLSWAAAITLGAIVAPPDAVAAASVLKRFRLPKRILAVLEGESLINDASALVLYRVGVAATIAGTVPAKGLFGAIVVPALSGLAIGAAFGMVTNWLMRHLKDRFLEIVTSFLAAFLSYLVAEQIDGSGVLAAVVCGGLIGRAQLKLSAQTRLETNSAWELVEFTLSSLVFLLVGLQLRGILSRIAHYQPGELLMLGAIVSLVLIVSRFLWVFATFYPASAIMAVIRGGSFTPPPSYPTIISWSGMRGVVSLAAALALPLSFPGRDLIIFLAFCAIFTTLVVQGTTLKLLIRWVNIDDPQIHEVTPATQTAREIVAAAIAGVGPNQSDASRHPVQAMQHQEDRARARGTRPSAIPLATTLQDKLARIQAAREDLRSRRDAIDGETLMTLTEELDLEERQILLALGKTSE